MFDSYKWYIMIDRLHIMMDWMSTHLNIIAIEAMFFHFERKTPRLHNPSIQIGFKLDALKGVQVIAPSVWNQAVNKNIVQGFWAPLIAGVWQIQLFWHVLITKYLSKHFLQRANPDSEGKVLYTIHISEIYPTYTWYMPLKMSYTRYIHRIY